jgi:hypothetical protein
MAHVTVADLSLMASILALNIDADPAKKGFGEEPYLTEWNTLRAQIIEMKAQGIGVDTAFDLR